MSFYVSTQMALRQHMVFHGEEGFIEVLAPFNTGLYAHGEIILHDQNHATEERFKFGGINQYALQVDAFARKVKGENSDVFSLEDSIKNQKVIDAIYASGESGNWSDV